MKQIVVVGGSSGLGNALVKDLIDRKNKVVVLGRTKPADGVQIERFYAVDATTVDWSAMYLAIEKETARSIDSVIFVAGAGIFGNTNLIPVERAKRVFELNFWACSNAARAAAECWSARGQAGKFVAILSIAARRAVPFEAYYSASKAATTRFLECLQLEYAHKQIEFICAFPGLLNTGFRDQAEWYGLGPKFVNQGANVRDTARTVIKLLEGERKIRVIGWRERAIDFADRILPGLYDRTVLRARTKRLLRSRHSC